MGREKISCGRAVILTVLQQMKICTDSLGKSCRKWSMFLVFLVNISAKALRILCAVKYPRMFRLNIV